MATDLPEIRQRIVVDDKALDGLGSKFGSVAGTLGKAVAAGAAVAAAAVGAFVVSGVRGAMDVDRGLREVNTLFGLTGDAAEANFRKMRTGVADLSSEMGIAQDVLTSGLYSAISAGVPEDNVFEFMKVASKAAIGGVTDVETAVDGLSTIINAWGLEASEAEAVADSMFAAVQGGKTTFEELSASIFQVAPAAAAAGIGFDEVNAAVATLTSAGVPTAVATTRIRAAIDELAKPTTQVAKTFEELTGKGFREFIASGGSVEEALAVLQDHAEDTGVAIGDLFGSVEAGGAATILATTGAEKFREELERQEAAAGGATMAFEEMEKSTARQMEKLKVNFSNAAMAVGHELLPVLNRVIEWATEMLPPAIERAREIVLAIVETFVTFRDAVVDAVAWISERWETLEPILRGLGIAMAVVFGPAMIARIVTWGATMVAQGALAVASWVASKAAAISSAAVQSAQLVMVGVRAVASAASVVAAIGTIVGAYAMMALRALASAAQVALSWLIAMGPIALVIAAVAGLVYLIIKHWDTIKATIAAGWEFVKRKTREIWEGLTSWLSSTWASIVGAIRGAWDTIKSSISSAWENVKSTTTGALTSVVEWVRALPGRLLDALAALATTVLAFIREYHPVIVLWRAMRDKAPDLWAFVREIPGKILDALGNVGTMLFDAGKQIIQGLIDGIKSMAGKVGDAIGGIAGKVRGFLPFSPAKEGPLAGAGSPDLAGAKIGSMIADGLEASTGQVARAAGRVAGAAAAGFDGHRPAQVAPTDARQYHYTAQATGSPVVVDEDELVRQLHRLELLAAPLGGR